MGAKSIRTTDDCARHDCDVGVECTVCGRLAVFEASDFGARVGNSLEQWISPLICRCGSREARVKPIHRCNRPDPLPKRRAPLVPLYVKRGRRGRPRTP